MGIWCELQKMKRVKARKKSIETGKKTNSIRKTTKLWKASRSLVRKWVKRYKQGKKD